MHVIRSSTAELLGGDEAVLVTRRGQGQDDRGRAGQVTVRGHDWYFRINSRPAHRWVRYCAVPLACGPLRQEHGHW